MSRKWFVGMVLAAMLAIPAVGWAHGGHTHKVMGNVSSIQGNHVEVKTTDGKVVMVMLDEKTAITRGKTKLDATALKVGVRVSIDATQEKEQAMMMAKAVKLAAAPAAAKK